MLVLGTAVTAGAVVSKGTAELIVIGELVGLNFRVSGTESSSNISLVQLQQHH